MDIKISVIIPVFNMSKWIGKAIDTVEKQTLKELEIICIDDGSTDITSDILLSYREKYQNLHVIIQENQGAGAARNTGIEKAQGEYLSFLDADDYYYSEDALEYLYRKAKENNAMICRGSSCDDREGVISTKGLRPERTFREEGFIPKDKFPGAIGYWAGIYNRRFLIEKNIRFPNLRRAQDGVFVTNCIAKAGQVYCVPQLVYVYRKEHKTVHFTEEKAVDLLEGEYQILKTARNNGMTAVYNAWRRELYGEKAAVLYHYAASGNKRMRELAKELNVLTDGKLFEGEAIDQYVQHVTEQKRLFLNHLKSQDAVYVFGAGTVARRLLAYLTENGIKPTAIIVSDLKQNPEMLEGIPVKPISSIQTDVNYTVIIATFWYLQDEISDTLRAQGVKSIIPLDLCEFHLWQDHIVH